MIQFSPAPSTNRVRLRDVAEDDLPIFYAHQLDPDATQMAAFSSRPRDAFLAHWARILANADSLEQTILVDGQVAGNIVCYEQGGEWEVGYWLGKEYWGQGVATEALAQLLAQVQTRPLYAHVVRHNIASRRVLEKCGFRVVRQEMGLPDATGAPVEEFILILS